MGKEKTVKFLKLDDTISVIGQNCNINNELMQDIVCKYGFLLPCGECITDKEFSELIATYGGSEKEMNVLNNILTKAV